MRVIFFGKLPFNLHQFHFAVHHSIVLELYSLFYSKNQHIFDVNLFQAIVPRCSSEDNVYDHFELVEIHRLDRFDMRGLYIMHKMNE